MPVKPLWIDRTFVFDLPVDMFPNVLERLRGTPARVEARIADIRPEMLKLKPDGKWSITETIGHLTVIEEIWLGRLDDFAAGLDELRPADMSNQGTEDADFNVQEPAHVLAGFRQSRGIFVSRLESLTDDEIVRPARHPRLDQPMRILDLMVFAAEHDDHHLAGIGEIMSVL
jgi:uncharacterized damage-inducible protein DinB